MILRMCRLCFGLSAVCGLVLTGLACRDVTSPSGMDEAKRPRSAASTSTSSDALTGADTALVQTDKFDYLPGDTVRITGAMWLPNERVLMVIDEVPEVNPSDTLFAVADSAGLIFYDMWVVRERHRDMKFTLKARGESSGRVAHTAFTDGHNVASASPSSGSTAGGFTVSIAGVFPPSGSYSVRFGDGAFVPASLAGNPTGYVSCGWGGCTYVIASYPMLVTTAPAHAAGTVTITVRNTYQFCSWGTCDPPRIHDDEVENVLTFVSPNTAPVVFMGGVNGVYSGPEGAAVNLTLSASDANGDQLSYTLDYGDGGTATGTLLGTADGDAVTGAAASHVYADNGSYQLKLTVGDGNASAVVGTASVVISNVAPTVGRFLGATLNEGATFTISGAFTDPGADVWSATIDYGDGAGSQPLALSGKLFSLSHRYFDNGMFTVTVGVTDDEGGQHSETATVTVSNVHPVLAPFSPTPSGPGAASYTTSLSASFTDDGIKDAHAVEVDWDDGLGYRPAASGVSFVSATGAANEGTGTISLSNTYTAAGVYTIKLRVRDDDIAGFTIPQGFVPANGEQVAQQYVVVYDPSAGFATGGGWIDSFSGDCSIDAACQTASGRATFGFVSKYLPGATRPSGNTEFEFKAGNFRFKSASYEWLVVAGARAQYKGEGTVNGVAGYKFLLTAIDGAVNGGGGVDKFRIKVSNVGGVVYDNQRGQSEDSDAATAIGGGSVVIHARK